ncbi:MAG: leucine dehydrogenase [Hydrogenibacillus schlegelii]|uniref:Leucine dehydrogenase n=1 Tax=Hydrogenibacillus schlegelii TaxID=1484 RepID=A0A947D3D2_HYDSH|nr:leucine dehydrogenase [Hydrogenibacillus schlegelii]
MKVLEQMQKDDYEQVVFVQDRGSGLRAIIAIHDTTLGPALGGVRMWPYASEEEALRDVLRLARGMTFKSAAAGLDLGGGKAVILGDPKRDKSEALFRAFGRAVHALGGRYITAEDVGTTVEDLEHVFKETPYVTGISSAFGSSGNPAPVTAFGVFQGMRAAAEAAFGSDDLRGRTVALQGAGQVAYHLARHLAEAGARLIVTDLDPEKAGRIAREFGAETVPPDAIYDVEADIFSPNALGGVLNDETIPRLRVRLVAGAANNQLESPHHARALKARGILYAPDFIINAGGVINVADELSGYDRERVMRRVAALYDRVKAVIAHAEAAGVSTHEAAEALALRRIETVRSLKHRLTLPERRPDALRSGRRG